MIAGLAVLVLGACTGRVEDSATEDSTTEDSTTEDSTAESSTVSTENAAPTTEATVATLPPIDEGCHIPDSSQMVMPNAIDATFPQEVLDLFNAWDALDKRLRYEEMPDRYGGSIFDYGESASMPNPEPAIRFWIVDLAPEDEAAIAAALPEGAPVEFHDANYSLNDLYSLRVRLNSEHCDHDDLAAVGVVTAGAGEDIESNTVWVEICDLTPEKEDILTDKYGGDALTIMEDPWNCQGPPP